MPTSLGAGGNRPFPIDFSGRDARSVPRALARSSASCLVPVVPLSSLPPLDLQALRPLVQAHLQWEAWARCIAQHGITIERPRATAHPAHPSILYPLDYGFVNDTLGSDGDALDVFVGSGTTGLVGALLTTDYRKGDREAKLLYDCTPAEVYTAHGFINYDQTLLEGVLVMRQPMATLWDKAPRCM